MLPTLWVHSHPITKYNDQFYYKKVHDIYPSVPGHPMPDIWYYPVSYVIILCTVILSLFMLVFPLPWHHTLMECYQLVWYRFSYKDFSHTGEIFLIRFLVWNIYPFLVIFYLYVYTFRCPQRYPDVHTIAFVLNYFYKLPYFQTYPLTHKTIFYPPTTPFFY